MVAKDEEYVNRFWRIVGLEIHPKTQRIETYSDTAALCHLTREIVPKDSREFGMDGCVYGYRAVEDGRGHWVFVLCDQEIEGILKRVPNVLELV